MKLFIEEMKRECEKYKTELQITNYKVFQFMHTIKKFWHKVIQNDRAKKSAFLKKNPMIFLSNYGCEI